MKPLVVPKNIKVGDTFYTGYASYDADWEPTHEIDVNEWVVRSIKKQPSHVFGLPQWRKELKAQAKVKVYLVRKIEGVTWIKSGFGKNAKWGWSKNISKDFRRSFNREDEFLPFDIFNTKKQALVTRIEKVKLTIERLKGELRVEEIPAEKEYYNDAIVGNEKLISMIKGRITKLKKS